MVASITVGVVGFGGLAFLIPNAIVAQGGTAADAGAVLATRGLFMLLGPAIGYLADRFVAHRAVQLVGLLSLGGGAASFAFARTDLTYLLAAFLFGLGLSACLSINLTLVVGAGLSEDETAQKLSVVLQSAVVGQVLGLALVGLLTTTGVSFRGRFLVLAVLAVIGTTITAATNRGAVARLYAHQTPDQRADVKAPVEWRQVLLSQFGLVMLLVLLIHGATQALEGQYPNYMQSVFRIDPAFAAEALAIIVLVRIPLHPLTARLSARTGPRLPFLATGVVRAAAALGLLLLGSSAPALAPIAFYGLIQLCYPFFELNASLLAARTSPIGAPAGQGALVAAQAAGVIVGMSLAGGVAANVGFSSLATITLVGSALAFLVGVVVLRVPGDNTG